ncbi:PH domain-containing protein [Georgenia sp. Z1491]|uniref:PH domain-containing protein n=1 Tax=Georgenia sp. Z1491 TaxID=3416707 RepID=UPI003CF92AE6
MSQQWPEPHPEQTGAGAGGPDGGRPSPFAPPGGEQGAPFSAAGHEGTAPVAPHGAERPSPFAPPGVPFLPVDQNLAKVRMISAVLWIGPFVVAGTVFAIWLGGWGWWLATGLHVAALVWTLLLVPRQVRAMGYCEMDEDLLFRKGLLWRSLVVVPYGRMQQIDVEAGPLDRRFGIASVKLSTASAQTDAKIPGLPADEAARLRESLTSRGEARLAGL